MVDLLPTSLFLSLSLFLFLSLFLSTSTAFIILTTCLTITLNLTHLSLFIIDLPILKQLRSLFSSPQLPFSSYSPYSSFSALYPWPSTPLGNLPNSSLPPHLQFASIKTQSSNFQANQENGIWCTAQHINLPSWRSAHRMHTYYEINFILTNSLKLWISYHTPSKGISGFQVRIAGIELMIFEYVWMIQDLESACLNLSLCIGALNSSYLITLTISLECGSGHLYIFLGSRMSM